MAESIEAPEDEQGPSKNGHAIAVLSPTKPTTNLQLHLSPISTPLKLWVEVRPFGAASPVSDLHAAVHVSGYIDTSMLGLPDDESDLSSDASYDPEKDETASSSVGSEEEHVLSEPPKLEVPAKTRGRTKSPAPAKPPAPPKARGQAKSPAPPKARGQAKSPAPPRTPTVPSARQPRQRETPGGSKPVKLANGLEYTVKQPGSGPKAASGSSVTLHYQGRIAKTSRVFDSTMPDGEPIMTKVGGDDLIAGLDQVLPHLSAGAEVRVRIPPKLGYGSEGDLPDIPANAWLDFDVKVLRVDPPATRPRRARR